MKIRERFINAPNPPHPPHSDSNGFANPPQGAGDGKTWARASSGGKESKIGVLLVELAKWETPRTRKDIARMKWILGKYKPGSGWEDRYRKEMILLVNSVTNKEVSGEELFEMVKAF